MVETKSCDVNRILSLTPSSLLITSGSPVMGLEIVEKTLTCCGQNRLITGLQPWKAQKSSSPCPAFISHSNQLVFNATCCCCYCYCEVIICFKAYLLPGEKKMFFSLLQFCFLSLSLFPLSKSLTWESWNNDYTLFYSLMFRSEKTDTLSCLISDLRVSSYLFYAAWYKAELWICHVNQMEFGKKYSQRSYHFGDPVTREE